MEKFKLIISKIIYGSVFCLLLPYLLIFWAKSTSKFITLPTPDLGSFSLIIIALGFIIIVMAMYNLWKKGKGLPMNAYPPENYVKSGLYYFFHHPIYLGAVVFSIGISLFFKSSSGLWLISPIFILLILAYVIGFENEIISKAFNHQTHHTFFDFPQNNVERLSIKNKLLIYVWVYFPWFLIYEIFIFLGVPKDAVSTEIILDKYISLVDFTVIFYVLVYPLSLLIPFILKTNKEAREFIFDIIGGMILIFFCYLVFPFIVNYETISQDNLFLKAIALGRETDGQTAALPSFHVFWALIIYKYFSKTFPKSKILFFLISILIIISCLTTKNHTILDVLFGIIAYFVVINRELIYLKSIQFCEKISNSWQEWRFGKIRIINHGFYAAIGGFFGFVIMGYFLPNQLYIIYIIGIAGFVGAGLWAQFVEGSPMLLRPFGYYGSVLGIALTLLSIIIFTDLNFWFLLGISCLAACIIQFFGRFRCLVQGCCHGKPTDKVLGIKFCHPKSRVNKIAHWKGKNLYPTQFYSIVSNFFTFLILLRFYYLEMPASFIGGMYFILNGIFRFVEESLRGEPQTPYFMGMRVYQWLAILSILMGIAFTCVNAGKLPTGILDFHLFFNALLYSLLVLFAYGIDFPESNVRFSRLTQ